jgi:hypothetical protein
MILTRREAPGRVHPQARRDRLLSHSSRQDLEPTVRQALIGYVGFAASISATPPAAMGRFEPAGPRRTGRSRSTVVRWPHGGQLSNALLTLMAALAAELDVGLMAFTRHTPSGGGRLLTLQCRP